MSDDAKLITDAIKNAEARLAELDEERRSIIDRLQHLRTYLSNLAPVSESSSLTQNDKIALFRSLFAGRDDVYPKQWISKTGDRKGYMPACVNDGNYGLCGKRRSPRIKCSYCENQAFIPVTDDAIRQHLQGKQTIGVYPLLPDDTCRFLAADFDKATWQEDVTAFRETSSALGLPVAVERSRSGNGAHVWFFFSEPVPAATARILGCYLITETMTRRHQLNMESYDRLFPSQDTLPRGGFGNLIALPLQQEPRQQGNSVFVDESFHPYPDQWAYLSSLKRLSAQGVQAIAAQATRSQKVIGLRLPSDHDEEQAPWEQSPSGCRTVSKITGKLRKRLMRFLPSGSS